MHSRGDGICLCQISDAERGKDSEQGKEPSQGGADPLILKSMFHGVHGPSGHLSGFIYFAVFDGEHTLTEFGCEAEECGEPHPDQGAGTAGYHGSGDTDDISRSDGGCKGGSQGRKR